MYISKITVFHGDTEPFIPNMVNYTFRSTIANFTDYLPDLPCRAAEVSHKEVDEEAQPAPRKGELVKGLIDTSGTFSVVGSGVRAT